jgi:hypothetical protein
VRVGVHADVGEPGAHGVEGAAGGDIVDEEAACASVYVYFKRKKAGQGSREGGRRARHAPAVPQ